MASPDRAMEIFLEVQRGLPRQGPGLRECTLRALDHCGPLPETPRVLDIGCGPGMQTLVLADALPRAEITALDFLSEFLEQLEQRVRDASVAERVTAVEGDMRAMPFEDGSFDLLWSEGAAYSMGFENALREWRRFLRPGGSLAVSELVWLVDQPPPEAVEFWATGYPDIAKVDEVVGRIQEADYELVAHFTLPDVAWWTDYYSPLEAKLPDLRARYEGDAEALDIIEDTAREIDVRRRFGDSYGYEFFVAKRPS